jgi:hypothetical protein
MKFTNENIPREIVPSCEWRPKDDVPWYREGNIVYSKLRCLNEVFDAEQEPYVLVTEEGDYTVYEYGTDFYRIRHTNGYPFGYIKDIPDTVIKWFGTNLNFYHPKVELLPFGTLRKHSKMLSEEPLKDPKDKELLYINFSPASSYSRRDLYYRVRNCDFATVEWPPADVPQHVYDRYLLNYGYMVSMHKFMLCPEGCGIDTFRIWEALSLGCIPIVEKSYFSWYLQDLPVLIVDDFSELTQDILNLEYEEIMAESWNLDKLKKEYWNERIVQESNG